MSFGIRVIGFGGGGGGGPATILDTSINGVSQSTPQNPSITILTSSIFISRLRLFINSPPLSDINDNVVLSIYGRSSRLGGDMLLKVVFRSTFVTIVGSDWLSAEAFNDVSDANRFLVDDSAYFMTSGDFGRVVAVAHPQLHLAEPPTILNPNGGGISRVLELASMIYTDQDAANTLFLRLESESPVLADYRLLLEYLPR